VGRTLLSDALDLPFTPTMSKSTLAHRLVLPWIAVATVVLWLAVAVNPASAQKGTTMSGTASGPFDVKVTPQEDKVDPTLGRMTLDKTFHGDLDATSKGQMLTASTETKGSAGYVAVERVTGTLKTSAGPRTGSFALQHFATLSRGTPELRISVVPDSGAGQLTGLTGKMSIDISAGKHSYVFEYTLPESN
jgi:hypothetical protein